MTPSEGLRILESRRPSFKKRQAAGAVAGEWTLDEILQMPHGLRVARQVWTQCKSSDAYVPADAKRFAGEQLIETMISGIAEQTSRTSSFIQGILLDRTLKKTPFGLAYATISEAEKIPPTASMAKAMSDFAKDLDPTNTDYPSGAQKAMYTKAREAVLGMFDVAPPKIRQEITDTISLSFRTTREMERLVGALCRCSEADVAPDLLDTVMLHLIREPTVIALLTERSWLQTVAINHALRNTLWKPGCRDALLRAVQASQAPLAASLTSDLEKAIALSSSRDVRQMAMFLIALTSEASPTHPLTEAPLDPETDTGLVDRTTPVTVSQTGAQRRKTGI